MLQPSAITNHRGAIRIVRNALLFIDFPRASGHTKRKLSAKRCAFVIHAESQKINVTPCLIRRAVPSAFDTGYKEKLPIILDRQVHFVLKVSKKRVARIAKRFLIPSEHDHIVIISGIVDNGVGRLASALAIPDGMAQFFFDKVVDRLKIEIRKPLRSIVAYV